MITYLVFANAFLKFIMLVDNAYIIIYFHITHPNNIYIFNFEQFFLQENYYKSLSDEANTMNLPSVLTMIRDESSNRFLHNIQNYRNDVYKIVDDKTYIIISEGKKEVFSNA